MFIQYLTKEIRISHYDNYK